MGKYAHKNSIYLYIFNICVCVYTHPHIYKAFIVKTKQLAKLTHEVGLNHKPFKRSRLISQFSAKQSPDIINILFKD